MAGDLFASAAPGRGEGGSKMRSSWPWLVTFALVALTSTGCAKGVASMSVTQIAPAGLEPQDVVGVVVVNGTEAMEQKWAQSQQVRRSRARPSPSKGSSHEGVRHD